MGLPASFSAAMCLVGVFCGVVNCPIASVILGVELFGPGALPYFGLVCAVSFFLSGESVSYTHLDVYKRQPILTLQSG